MRRFMTYFNALLLGMILAMIFLAIVHDCSAEFGGYLVGHNYRLHDLRPSQNGLTASSATADNLRTQEIELRLAGWWADLRLAANGYWNWNQFTFAMLLPPLKTMYTSCVPVVAATDAETVVQVCQPPVTGKFAVAIEVPVVLSR